MENEPPSTTSHLFTLRLWLEALGEGQEEWRGQLKYVPTGETYYFREWSQLHGLLQQCLPGLNPFLPGSVTDDTHGPPALIP